MMRLSVTITLKSIVSRRQWQSSIVKSAHSTRDSSYTSRHEPGHVKISAVAVNCRLLRATGQMIGAGSLDRRRAKRPLRLGLHGVEEVGIRFRLTEFVQQ